MSALFSQINPFFNLGFQSWTRKHPILPRLLPLSHPWEKCPVPEIAPLPKRPPNHRRKPKIMLWNSWLPYGEHIDSSLLLSEAKAARSQKLPLDYIFLDDGWATWGDWLTPDQKKFSQGIPSLVQKLLAQGYQTGLWLAPYLADARSLLFRTHPDWFVRDSRGKPINAYLASPLLTRFRSPKYLLDFQNPAVTTHLHKTLDTIVGWGIKSLKLDFLYAPYFKPGLTDDLPPYHSLLQMFSFLQNNYPDIYIIACGCPFKPAAYHVDAIRIGPDLSWPLPSTPNFVRPLITHHRRQILYHKLPPADSPIRQFFGFDPDAIPSPKFLSQANQEWEQGLFDVLGIGYSLR